MDPENSPEALTPKEEDLASELRDLRRKVISGRYEVPTRDIAEAVLFWHFGMPTDLFWGFGIPTKRQREDARKTAS